MPEAKTTGRSIVWEFPTGEKFLLGEIEIDCPECPPMTLRIPGHHMPAVLKLLAEWIADNPELTAAPNLREVGRTRFSGQAPEDPRSN